MILHNDHVASFLRWRPKMFKRHVLDDEQACTQTNMKIIGSTLPFRFYICNEDEGLIKSCEFLDQHLYLYSKN